MARSWVNFDCSLRFAGRSLSFSVVGPLQRVYISERIATPMRRSSIPVIPKAQMSIKLSRVWAISETKASKRTTAPTYCRLAAVLLNL